ncbi:MAG: hypothetical protein MJ179_02240 [Treponema sp.]|nr:hypothetical protein [Treponema sp.]
MITIIHNEKKGPELDYNFSNEEITLLAKFLRDRQNDLPEGLERFYATLENAIYNSLSLEEAKKLYS